MGGAFETIFLMQQVDKAIISALEALVRGDPQRAESALLALRLATGADQSLTPARRLAALEKVDGPD